MLERALKGTVDSEYFDFANWKVIDRVLHLISLLLCVLVNHGPNNFIPRPIRSCHHRHVNTPTSEHYQAFAGSLPHHAHVISLLGETQKHIAEARTSLTDARAALSHQRADLVQLWSRGQVIEEMMGILDEMCVSNR